MSLKVVRIKDRPTLYVRGSVLGKPVFETTGTADPKLAEAYRIEREREVYHGRLLGERTVVTFADAALSYLEQRDPGDGDRKLVFRILDYFCPGHENARQNKARWPKLFAIGQAEVDRCVSAVLRPGAKPATRARLISVIQAVLNHAARRKWCDPPALEKPRLPQGRTLWLLPSEAERLLEAAGPHIRPMLVLFLGTGARVAEAIDLEWPDVQLASARVRFRETKSGHDRVAAMPPSVIAALANVRGRDGHVFRRPDGLPYADRGRIEGGQIKTAFRGAVRRAGLSPAVTPHVLRHSWATYLYALTKDLLLLRDEGGWHSTRMVERYAHLAEPGLEQAILGVWGGSHPRVTRDAGRTEAAPVAQAIGRKG